MSVLYRRLGAILYMHNSSLTRPCFRNATDQAKTVGVKFARPAFKICLAAHA